MRVSLAAAILILFRAPAFAHRLDEYLQATIVEVEKDRFRAEVTLTPGVAVSDFVIHTIDTDGDGTISTAEGQAYAARFLEDLTLTLDGRRLALQVTSAQFPALSEMREGTGEIQLGLAAALPRGGRDRKVVLVNRHQSRIAVYEVNCLLPRDPRVRIGAQKRNYTQSVYELDYEETDEPHGMTSGLIWLTPLALFLTVRLVFVWRQRPAKEAGAQAFIALQSRSAKQAR
ncbi:MAG TPA: hypothetical protein VLY24_06055 [Bryobacteraceae bacterium]|nr:hypothetical protein [Bryobacteraceae bacterium]